MEIFCTQGFIKEYTKLKKNSSYNDIEQVIIRDIINSNIDSLKLGARLTGTPDMPFMKKRLSGSSGYRIYFLLLIKGDKVYITFIHPKTGSYGGGNMRDMIKFEENHQEWSIYYVGWVKNRVVKIKINYVNGLEDIEPKRLLSHIRFYKD